MIETLSSKQLAQLPWFRKKWLDAGLSTKPVNKSVVKKNLQALYAVAGKPAPKFVIHLESPLHIAIAIAQLRSGDSKVSDQVSAQVSDILYYWYDFGQFDSYWLSWYDFMGELGVDVSKLKPTFDLAHSAGWTILFWDWAFVSERPSCIARDEQNRLHCENGPAVGYNGFNVYAIHGVRVPEKVITAPKTLTVSEIDSERNAEVRRIMIERFGQDHYLLESKAEEIHRDKHGVLYRKEISGDEALVMVKLLNTTPETDGSISKDEAILQFSPHTPVCHAGKMIELTNAPAKLRFKTYFQRVPPTIERAKQAVAWANHQTEETYNPLFES